jgi:hypothetical protein
MGQPQKYVDTNLETWTRNDRYHNDRLIGPSEASLVHALATSDEAGLPQISVSEALVSQELLDFIVYATYLMSSIRANSCSFWRSRSKLRESWRLVLWAGLSLFLILVRI